MCFYRIPWRIATSKTDILDIQINVLFLTKTAKKLYPYKGVTPPPPGLATPQPVKQLYPLRVTHAYIAYIRE